MIKNILIIRFSSLGDVVLTTGVIKHIKENRPDINIDVLTMTQFAGVFADFEYVRNIYCVDKGSSLKTLLKTIKTLPKYDYVFDLHSNLRSFIVKLLISAKNKTYSKNTIARRLYVKFRLFRWALQKHNVEKYFDIFKSPLQLADVGLEELRPFIKNPLENRNSSDIKTVVIHPFASKNAKIWPYFNELIKILLDDGLNVRIVGSGTVENLPLKAEDKTGFTPLNLLIRNIADSDVVLSTDSGPMHIATALNKPTIAIFGSTTKELGFYPNFKNCKVIEDSQLNCRPCDIHGGDCCPLKHFLCMRNISVEEVRHHIHAMLKK